MRLIDAERLKEEVLMKFPRIYGFQALNFFGDIVDEQPTIGSPLEEEQKLKGRTHE